MKLGSLADDGNPTLTRLRLLVANRSPAHYGITEFLNEADVTFLIESGYIGLESMARLRALLKQARTPEVYIFSESDWPFPYIPGLYCSLSRALPWAQSWSFLLDGEATCDRSTVQERYMYSFIGRVATHPLRRELLRLDTVNTPCVDISSAQGRFPNWNYRGSYWRTLRASRFVLCPRGVGASTIRIFEAMRAGAVPVIIGDDWLEPPIGDWSQFSIRVPERAVLEIPGICAAYGNRATAMGEIAKETFAQHFAPEAFLDNALDFMRSNLATRNQNIQNMPGILCQAISLRELRSAVHALRSKFAPRRTS